MDGNRVQGKAMKRTYMIKVEHHSNRCILQISSDIIRYLSTRISTYVGASSTGWDNQLKLGSQFTSSPVVQLANW
jgi:hypothetical protein